MQKYGFGNPVDKSIYHRKNIQKLMSFSGH